jgi:hypothetical protein
MRKLFPIFTALIITATVFAQAPKKISYQAVIRNTTNALVINHTVGMKISILQDSATGTSVYTETQTSVTNANGLVSIEIGGGIVVCGSFDSINWTNGLYFIKTETDYNGGTNYTISGTSQLLSVPYTLYANNGITAAEKIKLAALNNADGSETKINAGTNISLTGTGTIASPYVVYATAGGSSGFTHYIGEQFGGGVIFHLYKDNIGVEHGLIVALTDQSSAQAWSNVTITLIGPTAQSPWDGLSNSNAIVGQTGHTSSAAKLCLDLVSGGQNDWYLPSIQEFNLLLNNYYAVSKTLSNISGAAQLTFNSVNSYWTSTEYNQSTAFYFLMCTGYLSINAGSKNSPNYIRAVRTF